MRRHYFGLAIAALTTLGSMQAWGGDREIAQQIIQRLKSNRDSGALKNFKLDMKVDKGVVLLRGNVSAQEQKELVLSAASGIEGIINVVDELSVPKVAPAVQPVVEAAVAQVTKPAAKTLAVEAPPVEQAPAIQQAPAVEQDLPAQQDVAAQQAPVVQPTPAVKQEAGSFQEALIAEAALLQAKMAQTQTQQAAPVAAPATPAASTFIQPAAAFEEQGSDNEIVAAIVGSLGQAKDDGRLKGFGVDVKCDNGVVTLNGRAASVDQRSLIVDLASNVQGVSQVRETIAIPVAAPTLQRPIPRAPAAAPVPARVAAARLPQPAAAPLADSTPLPHLAAAPVAAPVPYHHPQQQLQAHPIQYAQPASVQSYAGHPVPVGAYGQGGAPRYDSPNLPNYAWPGYAAQSNYAALTYPQQYSPSAWPFIGPFYPYPQVPLGWRKVSLEWDDGWWFLDFTDK